MRFLLNATASFFSRAKRLLKISMITLYLLFML